MARLKPSKRDLDYGLGLHHESLVFESYGFAPRSAGDLAARLEAAYVAGAAAEEIMDLREDIILTDCAVNPDDRDEILDAWREAGVTCIFQNAGEEGSNPDRLLKRMARFTYVTDLLREELSRAAWPEDVEAAFAAGKRCLYLTTNGVPIRGRFVTAREELPYIRTFFQLGARMMHLTYNRRNMLGDGCGESADAGLSDFGRRVIAEMNRQGVIVDVAHSGQRTSLEAAEISAKPVVASHAAVGALSGSVRAKSDEVIRAIADTGGYIGIVALPGFLGGTGDINALLDHIDYVVTHFGPDYAAIGTDRVYLTRDADVELAKARAYGNPNRPRRWESLWPEDDQYFLPRYREDELYSCLDWTNYPLFTVGMVQRGYSDDAIRKILGSNVLRVCKSVLEGRHA